MQKVNDIETASDQQLKKIQNWQPLPKQNIENLWESIQQTSSNNSSIQKYGEDKQSRAALKNRSETKNDEDEKYHSMKK